MRDLTSVAEIVTHDLAAAAAATVAGRLGHRSGAGAAGRLTREEASPAATNQTFFDLASVTKPMVALSLARLVEQGACGWDEALVDLLPDAAGTPSERTPLELLASHRSGLAAHLELFDALRRGQAVHEHEARRTALCARRADCEGDAPPPGFPPVYSDMGYLLLGFAIEARTGEPLAEVVRSQLIEPLGLVGELGSAHQLAERDPDFETSVAPTEFVEFRGGLVRGVVHDENAWALRGRHIAGHAGLFGRAQAVLRVGDEILQAHHGQSSWLSRSSVERLIRPRPGGSLRAGFDGRTPQAPSSGSRLGPRTFGHLGFTGTSLWIDPDQDFVGVLLSNRVHPTREHLAIRKARPAAYDAMFDALVGQE